MSWFSSNTEAKLKDAQMKLESIKQINENLTNDIILLKEKLKKKEIEIDELTNKLHHKEELKNLKEEYSSEKYYDIIINIDSLKGKKRMENQMGR